MKKNKQKEWKDFQNVIADALWKHTYEVIDRLKDAQKHDSQLVALEIAKVASEIGRLHNKALSQKEQEVVWKIRGVVEELSDKLMKDYEGSQVGNMVPMLDLRDLIYESLSKTK